MSGKGSHTVYRQRWNLKSGSTVVAASLQEMASEFSRNRLPFVLEQFCQELAPAGHHVRVERLELDLGDLPSWTDMQSLEQAVREKLYQYVIAHSSRHFPAGLQGNESAGNLTDAERKEGVPRQAIVQLQTGRRTWHNHTGQGDPLNSWVRGMVRNPVLAEISPLAGLLQKPEYLQRFMRSLPVPLIKQLALAWTEILSGIEQMFWKNRMFIRYLFGDTARRKDQELLETYLRFLSEQTLRNPGGIHKKWEAVFVDFLAEYIPVSLKPFAAKRIAIALRRMTQHKTAVFPEIEEWLAAEYAGKSAVQEIVESGISGDIAEKTENKSSDLLVKDEFRKLRELNPANEKSVKTGTQTFISELDNDGEWVENAGLVLLGTYLPAFFRELGFWDGQSWVNERMQHKAAWILQKIVFPELAVVPADMLLNKIICGIPAGEDIETRFHFTTRLRKECQDLLDAVVQNWDALKMKDSRGFPPAFLQRNGRLSFDFGQYQLSVEKNSYDILLDRLPWSYSTLKLPWNNYLIITDW
ncbi:MAG: hypothetical protein JNL57_12800 [Bacteroidetes bacterium]|nr:hypothetical protein [Bacteroidota bacterium]